MKFGRFAGIAALVAMSACARTDSSRVPNHYRYLTRVQPVAVQYDSTAVVEAPLEGALAEVEESIKPKWYLVDFSGSMDSRALNSHKSKLQIVQEHQYPVGAEVYAFAGGIGRYSDGTRIDSMETAGGTPLYHSLEEFLQDSTKHDGTGLVLTDGDDTNGGPSKETLADRAIAKRICLVFLPVGDISPSNAAIMDYINTRTCSDPANRNRAIDN